MELVFNILEPFFLPSKLPSNIFQYIEDLCKGRLVLVKRFHGARDGRRGRESVSNLENAVGPY